MSDKTCNPPISRLMTASQKLVGLLLRMNIGSNHLASLLENATPAEQEGWRVIDAWACETSRETAGSFERFDALFREVVRRIGQEHGKPSNPPQLRLVE